MSRREHEYTPEEAYALTLRDALPHWYGSVPLVVGVELPDRSYPQPLDASLNEGTWLFLFVSGTSTAFSGSLTLLRAWAKKYGPLGVRFIFVSRGFYPYFRERKTIEKWIESLKIPFPVFCDPSGALGRAFGVRGESGAAILREGAITFADEGANWPVLVETHLQTLIRETSPGTPFWPVRAENADFCERTTRWPLHEGAGALREKKVELRGKWSMDSGWIVAEDADSELILTSPSSSLGIVAKSLNDSGEATRVRFDSDGSAIPDTFAGSDFTVDLEGNSVVLVGKTRGYCILKNLPATSRKIRFRFLNAKNTPVAVYGLEFGDPFR